MKVVKFEEAIGQKLAHDICQITTSGTKKVAFKKGYIIKQEDKDLLFSLGKENFYILEENDDDLLHEDDIANFIFDTFNNGDFIASNITMGKINFVANKEGYFKVDSQSLINLNMLGELSVASISNYTYVKKGDVVASARLVPLFCNKDKLKQIENIKLNTNINMFEIKEIQIKKIGLITTGNEILSGTIKDGFKSKITSKLEPFNLQINEQVIVGDDENKIIDSIKIFNKNGYDLILLTGGMSVDPDDKTPGSIKKSGTNIILYGTPIIPGSMFLLGYLKDSTVLGLPGGMLFDNKTAFDIYLPKILLKEKYTKEEMIKKCVGGILHD